MPCRNAEPWVGAAIRSCLEQDVDLEVIVVDDRSTDASREVVASFGPPVIGIDGGGHGATAARNRAFEVSSGAYIQYLDADDLLLPGKIASQLAFLEEADGDAVYGDWRYSFSGPNGDEVGGLVLGGDHDDIVEALLDDWWVPVMALLHRRETVVAAGGWDVATTVNDDHDFLLSAAVAGCRIVYRPGAESLYRRHDVNTTSRRTPQGWLEGREALLTKAERSLVAADELTPPRRRALARSYFRLARWWWPHDRGEARRLLERSLALEPAIVDDAPRPYRRTYAMLGFHGAERLAAARRSVGRRLGRAESETHPVPGRSRVTNG